MDRMDNVNLQLTRVLAIIAGTLGVLGLFISGHLFDFINVDPVLDITRIGLALFLVYAGFVSRDRDAVNTALIVTGALYVSIAVLGLIGPSLGGLLPSGLTGFDIVFHLLTGGLAMWAGANQSMEQAART